MESQSQSASLIRELSESSFWIAVLAGFYLAVLPMAGTIALRNVTLAGLMIVLAWHFGRHRHQIRLPWPMLIWAIYVLGFPIISSDAETALLSLKSQWGRSLLALLAGAGTALATARYRHRLGAFYLGLISSVTIFVFIALAAWKASVIGSIPWGYWGRESHHADLGYAAGQAVILLAASIAVSEQKSPRWAILLIFLTLSSLAVAKSRAGLIFAVFGGGVVLVLAAVIQPDRQRRRFYLAMIFLTVVVSIFAASLAQEPEARRWRTLFSRLEAGFAGDPLKIECEGVGTVQAGLFQRYGQGVQTEQLLSSIQFGDGARVVLARAAWELALKHPWGSDGSKQAYQKLLHQECPNPAIVMAHAHNGWLDTVLAIGWPGAFLYLGLLVYFARQGYRELPRDQAVNPWAFVLLALAVFWMLRAAADSVLRDHMLEMQGFVLSYAMVRSRQVIRGGA